MWSGHSNWHWHGVPKAKMPGHEPLAAYDPDDLKHELWVWKMLLTSTPTSHCLSALLQGAMTS